jgi:hypothetical protein
MKALNFNISDGFTQLSYKGSDFDLHNDFDLVSFKHDKVLCISEIIFAKGPGDWVSKDNPNSLTLLFKNVENVYYKDHKEDYPTDYITQDEITVNMIGFSFSGNDFMDGVADHVPKPHLTSLIFVVETGKAIKIQADSVELLVG